MKKLLEYAPLKYFFGPSVPKPSLGAPPSPMRWVWANSAPFITPTDDPDTYITKGWDVIPNVYAIIDLILQKTTTIPYVFYRVADQKAYRKYKGLLKNKDISGAMMYRAKALEEVEDHPLITLLENPNSYQGYEELIYQFGGYYLLTGNSYMELLTPGAGRNAAIPQELHVYPSPTVEIIPSDEYGVAAGYRVGLYENEVEADRMIHIKTFNPVTSMEDITNGLYGDSPLKSCRTVLGRYASADIAQGAMFTNMGPAGILYDRSGTDMSQEQMQAAKDKLLNFKRGADNANGIIFTSADLGWQSIGLSPVDLNILDAKDEMLTELCNVYHAPKELFSNDEAKYSNKEQARKQLISDAVIPLAEKFKNTFNRHLVPRFGGGVVMEMDYSVFPEIQEDLGEKQKWVSQLWELTPNERRELLTLGRADNPLLDKIYVPRNLVALEDLGVESFRLDPDQQPDA